MTSCGSSRLSIARSLGKAVPGRLLGLLSADGRDVDPMGTGPRGEPPFPDRTSASQRRCDPEGRAFRFRLVDQQPRGRASLLQLPDFL